MRVTGLRGIREHLHYGLNFRRLLLQVLNGPVSEVAHGSSTDRLWSRSAASQDGTIRRRTRERLVLSRDRRAVQTGNTTVRIPSINAE